MPLPRRRKGERSGDFIDRCMSSSKMKEEFGSRDQRYAVCSKQSEKKSR